MNDLINNPSFLRDIENLCKELPRGHSKYQLENFVVKQKNFTPDIQYKQCLRELRMRYNALRELEFDYNDSSIQIKEYVLEIGLLESADPPALEDIRTLKIDRLHNQINRLKFRKNNIRDDACDLIREMEILKSLASSLEKDRKFSSFDEADSDYWSHVFLPESDQSSICVNKE